MRDLRAAYQVMVDMSVITMFIPFLYMFRAGWKLGFRWASASGAAVAVPAIIASVMPTADVRSTALFEIKIWGGCLVLGALAWWQYRRAQKQAA